MRATLEFDYVIVGGGTAGCVLAARLSEDPRHTVLLLEAGGEDRDWRFAVPGGQVFVRDWSQHAWMLPTEADPSVHDRADVWRRGRGLGGSSVINGAIWTVGLASDFDRWASAGAPGWDWRIVEPYFAKSESYAVGAPGRGRSGPVAVEPFKNPHPLAVAFLDSCASAGLPRVEDINRMNGEGIGIAQTNQRNGIRQSTARAYLKKARGRPNLCVLTDARADRILFSNRVATAVMFRRDAEQRRADARREIIICAGAFNSPHLLLLSGVGAAEQLGEQGVPIVLNSPGVGQGLQEHPELYLEYVVKQPTYSTQMRAAGLIGAALRFALTRSGPATSPATHVLGYLKTGADLKYPDILLFAGPWGQPEAGGAFVGERNIFSISPALCQPKSRGRVSLQTPKSEDAPRIEANLLSEPEDIATLIAAIRKLDQIASTPPFASALIERLGPTRCNEHADTEELEDWIRRTVGICYHASSTCRMGQDANAVVDPALRVRGIERLRICDTSVFPFVPSGNTAAPTVMLAERAADLIRAA